MNDEELQANLKKIDRLRDSGSTLRAGGADDRDGIVYRASRELKLALKLALATGRPLLLRGEPGSGKSSLAAYVARNLKWRFYDIVVTSRTQAQDLQWRYDAVRRLSDATDTQRTKDLRHVDYVEPGVLWWVLNPESARRRGAHADVKGIDELDDPNDEINKKRLHHAVVLIDEIDKADPDVPNGLLVPLGSSRFEVLETREVVQPAAGTAAPSALVIITTNEERQLPEAFVRRCVVHRLAHPDSGTLFEIASRHLKAAKLEPTADESARYKRIAERVGKLRTKAKKDGRRAPSTAEYLDAVWASRRLDQDLDDDDWDLIERIVLTKD